MQSVNNESISQSNSSEPSKKSVYSHFLNSIRSFGTALLPYIPSALYPENIMKSDPTKIIFPTNTFITQMLFVLIIILIFIVFFNLGIYFIEYLSKKPVQNSVTLVSGIIDGFTPLSFQQHPTLFPDQFIPRSNNQLAGAEMTWALWLNITDIVDNGNITGYQHIFNKGNSVYDSITGIATINNAPALYLSKSTNSLRIVMDTVNNDASIDGITTKNNTMDINNIPLRKWFHLAIRMRNRNIDVYINGIITNRLYLINVPKQNWDTVNVCQNGGFAGNYSDFTYYNYAIEHNKMMSIVNAGPTLNPSKQQKNTKI